MNQELLSNYYSQHRDEIVSFIAMRITDADDAQDMVQDIFMRLLCGKHLISPQTINNLISTMARHAVADYYRRRHVYEEYEHYIRRQDDSDEMESIISAQQLMERMERSLTRLPEVCATIYRLHIYEDMKVGEIAKQLTLPYKQVENRLGQARRHVRKQLRFG